MLIDMDFLEDIDFDKGIMQNININKILHRLEFGISNRAIPKTSLKDAVNLLEVMIQHISNISNNARVMLLEPLATRAKHAKQLLRSRKVDQVTNAMQCK